MRILYSHRVQSRDGQGVHIDELVAALREIGHQVLVVGPPAYENAKFGGENSRLANIRAYFPPFIYELLEILYNIPMLFRLKRALKEFEPDFIYERYNLYYFGALLIKKIYGIPMHLEINSLLAEERRIHGRLVFRRLARRLEEHNWRAADHVYP